MSYVTILEPAAPFMYFKFPEANQSISFMFSDIYYIQKIKLTCRIEHVMFNTNFIAIITSLSEMNFHSIKRKMGVNPMLSRNCK